MTVTVPLLQFHVVTGDMEFTYEFEGLSAVEAYHVVDRVTDGQDIEQVARDLSIPFTDATVG